MSESQQLVALTLDDQQYAVPRTVVERIVFAVEITPLPGAPDVVIGVVKVGSQIIPILDIRKRFNLPAREMELADRIVLAQTSKRTVGFLVDGDVDVIERSEQEVVSGEKIIHHNVFLEGVLKLEDGMIFIMDLERFLHLDEEERLNKAMTKTRERVNK